MEKNETISELFEKFKADSEFIEDKAVRESLADKMFSMMIEV